MSNLADPRDPELMLQLRVLNARGQIERMEQLLLTLQPHGAARQHGDELLAEMRISLAALETSLELMGRSRRMRR